MTALVKAALPGLVRPMVEPHIDGLDVTWFMSTEEAEQAARTAEIGWFDMYDKLRMRAIIESAENLKWLNTIYAGLDHFPLETLRNRGTTLTNGVGINAIPIAEFVVMGMLAAAKRLDTILEAQAQKTTLNGPPGTVELFEGKALIIGYGAIGQQIAKTLSGFNMDIIAVRRTPDSDPAIIGADEWRARLAEFDWVILAAPATDETRHMIGADELAAMKNSAWLVNVARGTLVDQIALAAALTDKAIAGAILDTVEPEPLPADDPLWDAPNTFLTMHLSGNATSRMFERAAKRFVENFALYRNGETMLAEANLDLGY
ncbi:MAG: D-2-hydroxyacid dehydrogenase [Parasphingopyxis sp.]